MKMLHWRYTLILIFIVPPAIADQEILGRVGSQIRGGIYIGKVRPYFWGDQLYLEPIAPRIQRDPPTCVKRDLLRLKDERTSLEFAQKFAILLESWIHDREVILAGNGNCSNEGDEFIIIVIPE